MALVARPFDGVLCILRAGIDRVIAYSVRPTTAQEVRRAVLEDASPVWRQAEDAVAGRVRQALPPIAADGTGSQPDSLQAIVDVLVAREIARIDMGIDLVIAQPN